MGWILRIVPPHQCPLPGAGDTRNYWWGSIWQCDTCQKRWELTGHVDGLWKAARD